MQMKTLFSLLLLAASAAGAGNGPGSQPAGPMYKPSSKSKAPLDITTNAYGHSGLAPNAPKIGEVVADFELPSTTGTFDFEKARQKGPLVLVFYRGDW